MAINFLDGITIDGLSTQGSEATALVINGSNVVGTRELGTNAFTSTTVGTTTNALTVDDTTVKLNSGTTFNGSAARTISAKTAAIANAGTGLATADQIHTFVTTQTDTTAADTSGNAATATALATARNIAGVSFDGTANISLNNNAITNGAGYTTNTGTTTASNSQTFTNKAGNISQWTNDSGYITSLSGAVLTTTNQTVGGEKTFSEDVVTTSGADGGMRMGGWPYNTTGYSFIGTTNMSGLEYCMLSDGTNTFLGAGTGGALKLRGPANDGVPEIIIDGTIVEVNAGDLKVTDGSIAVGAITNSTTDGRIDASNDVVAYSTSDIRLKNNIKTIDKALDKVKNIQGIEFDWIEKEKVHGNSGHDVGVIAQEIEKVLPDVVTTRDSGYKAVKYEKIVPLLIEAIKELSRQVDGLKRLI